MHEILGERPEINIEDLPIPDFKFTPDQIRVLKQTRDWVESFFKRAQEDGRVVMGGHGFDHNQRVSGMAAMLAVYEGYDPFLPALTGLIFDR